MTCLNVGFKSMGERIVNANRVLGMVTYVAASMVVNKLMYGCGALTW